MSDRSLSLKSPVFTDGKPNWPSWVFHSTGNMMQKHESFDRVMGMASMSRTSHQYLLDLARAVHLEMGRHPEPLTSITSARPQSGWTVDVLYRYIDDVLTAVAKVNPQFDWSVMVYMLESKDMSSSDDEHETDGRYDSQFEMPRPNTGGYRPVSMPTGLINIRSRWDVSSGMEGNSAPLLPPPSGRRVRTGRKPFDSRSRPVTVVESPGFGKRRVESAAVEPPPSSPGPAHQTRPVSAVSSSTVVNNAARQALVEQNERLVELLLDAEPGQFATERCLMLRSDYRFDGSDPTCFDVWVSTVESKVSAGHLSTKDSLLLIKQSLKGDALSDFLKRNFKSYDAAMHYLKRRFDDDIQRDIHKDDFDSTIWDGKQSPIKYLRYLCDLYPSTGSSKERKKHVCANLIREMSGKEREWAVECKAYQHLTLKWLEDRYDKKERVSRFGELSTLQPRVDSSKSIDEPSATDFIQLADEFWCSICDEMTTHVRSGCPHYLAALESAGPSDGHKGQPVVAGQQQKQKSSKSKTPNKTVTSDQVRSVVDTSQVVTRPTANPVAQPLQVQSQSVLAQPLYLEQLPLNVIPFWAGQVQWQDTVEHTPAQAQPLLPEPLPGLKSKVVEPLGSREMTVPAVIEQSPAQPSQGREGGESEEQKPDQEELHPRPKLTNVLCHNCQQYGHLQMNCPQPPKQREQNVNMVQAHQKLGANVRQVFVAHLDGGHWARDTDGSIDLWVMNVGIPKGKRLFDTGSTPNLVCVAWLDANCISYRRTAKKLSAVNATAIYPLGVVQLPVAIVGAYTTATFYAVDQLQHDVLIGTDTMDELGMTLSDNTGNNYRQSASERKVDLVARIREVFDITTDDEELVCIWPSHTEPNLTCASVALTKDFRDERERLEKQEREHRWFRSAAHRRQLSENGVSSGTKVIKEPNIALSVSVGSKTNVESVEQSDHMYVESVAASGQVHVASDVQPDQCESAVQIGQSHGESAYAADNMRVESVVQTEQIQSDVQFDRMHVESVAASGQMHVESFVQPDGVQLDVQSDQMHVELVAASDQMHVESVVQSNPVESGLPVEQLQARSVAASDQLQVVSRVQSDPVVSLEQPDRLPTVSVEHDKLGEIEVLDDDPTFVQFDGVELHPGADHGPELCDTWEEATDAVDWRTQKGVDDKAKFADELDVGGNLTADQRHLLVEALWLVRSAFRSAYVATTTQNVSDIGVTNVVHDINTEGVPFKVKARRIPIAQVKDVEKMVDELLEGGYIRKSKSPYSSCIVLVRKKDGSWRMCVDYRMLNSQTVADQTPLPRVDSLLDRAAGHEWLTALDIKAAYYNIRVRECDIEKTAFSVGDKLYEFTRMPFGLCTAAQTFQRAITEALHGVVPDNCLAYLDDVVVFSDTFEEHLLHVRAVCSALGKFGLKLNCSKSSFAQRQLRYLGHWINKDGIQAEGKVRSITEYPRPQTKKQMRRYLGLCKYLGRYYRHLAEMLKPLNEMTTEGKRLQGQLKWTAETITLFEALRNALASPPVLKPPMVGQTYYVVTDASKFGYGGILMQEHDKQLCPVYYASKSASGAEQRYAPVEQEARAVIYCLEKWRPYLLLELVQVLTDHRPLVSMFLKKNTDKITPRLYRWLLIAQQYRLTIRYLPGVHNEGADALSRIYEPPEGRAWLKVCAVRAQDAGVAAESKRSIAKRFHAGISGGHFGWRKVVKRLKSFYSVDDWPTMISDVKDVCQKCNICRQRSCRYQTVPLQPLPPPARPGQTWHLDFSEFRSGAQCHAAAVAVDAFSRWIIVLPTKKQDADAALKLMELVYNHSGRPLKIVTDSGTHFVCRQFQEYLADWDVEHLVCTPYQKTANGMAERAIQTMQEVIGRHCAEHKVELDRWHTIVDQALIAYNTSPHSSLGMRSPYEVERGVPFALSGNDVADKAALDDFWLKVRKDLLKAQVQYAEQYRHSRTANFNFAENDPVWVQHTQGMRQRKRKIDLPNRLAGKILRFKHRSAIVEMPDGKTRAVPLSMLQPRFVNQD